MSADLPRYRLVKPAYVLPARSLAARRFEAGEDFAFTGVPAAPMSPINAPAAAAKAAAIRAIGIGRFRIPAASDRSTLIDNYLSLGGTAGATIEEMASYIENWISNN